MKDFKVSISSGGTSAPHVTRIVGLMVEAMVGHQINGVVANYPLCRHGDYLCGPQTITFQPGDLTPQLIPAPPTAALGPSLWIHVAARSWDHGQGEPDLNNPVVYQFFGLVKDLVATGNPKSVKAIDYGNPGSPYVEIMISIEVDP